jgi:hypothetical protein
MESHPTDAGHLAGGGRRNHRVPHREFLPVAADQAAESTVAELARLSDELEVVVRRFTV